MPVDLKVARRIRPDCKRVSYRIDNTRRKVRRNRIKSPPAEDTAAIRRTSRLHAEPELRIRENKLFSKKKKKHCAVLYILIFIDRTHYIASHGRRLLKFYFMDFSPTYTNQQTTDMLLKIITDFGVDLSVI